MTPEEKQELRRVATEKLTVSEIEKLHSSGNQRKEGEIPLVHNLKGAAETHCEYAAEYQRQIPVKGVASPVIVTGRTPWFGDIDSPQSLVKRKGFKPTRVIARISTIVEVDPR